MSNYVYKENQEFLYTQEGIARLAMLLKASLEFRGWSARELARQSNLSAPTVTRYVGGTVKEPQEKVLKAIAPFVYKPVNFKKSEIEINTTKVFSSWQELATVATNDYLSVFRSMSVESEYFAKMIEIAMRENGISQELLQQRLDQQLSVTQFAFSKERAIEIQEGKGAPPTEEERRIFSMAADPKRVIFSLEEWMPEEVSQISEQSHTKDCGQNHVN